MDYITTISQQMGESDELYAAIKSFKGLSDIIDFSNGNPIAQPFLPAAKAGAQAFTSSEMRQYGYTSGLRSVRETVARYMEKDVYRNKVLVNADNVICGEGGVTAIYSAFLKDIIKPGDVVLVTAPGYGLFSNQPKIEGADVYAVPLREEDDYHHNSEMIDNAITNINKTGKHVRAFLFANPLNPTGNIERDEQLRKLAAAFIKHDVFVIEDMAYRGTVYDQQDPVHSIISVAPDLFPQTLTLESLSKGYGLAAARAGLAVGTRENIKKITDNMAVSVDTTALPQQKAIEATFHQCNNDERIGYLNKIAEEYKYRFAILEVFIGGIDAVDNNYKEKIEREILNIYPYRSQGLLDGMPGVKIITTPEAGFFAPVDFSNWRGKFFGNMRIETTHSFVVELLARNARILALPSQSMMWPTTNLIVRLSLVAEQMLPGREHNENPDIRNLIEGLARLKEISKLLTNTPQPKPSPSGSRSLLLQHLT